MKLDIVTSDSLKILTSTKQVLESAKFVEIDDKQLSLLVPLINNRLESGLDNADNGFGATGDIKRDSQLVLIEDAVNYCFWAGKGREKWQVESPDGKDVTGGWYGLVACFKRAIADGTPILDADYLAAFTDETARKFFHSKNDIDIPLLSKRVECLKEAGTVLKNKYQGQFTNFLKESCLDAVKIVKAIVQDFSFFNDVTKFNGIDVFFYKRAQILAHDLTYLSDNGKPVKLTNINELTAFADYKIPQMLRNFKVIRYSDELSEKVDNYILIEKDSREEVEIRSATIWGVELLRQQMPEHRAAEIDKALWLISQDQSGVEKPYHRTYTIFY